MRALCGNKAQQTRGRILDAAAALFRDRGYAAVSLRSIAEAAQLQGGSVYYHFESKEQLVTEVLNIGIQMVFDAVDAVVRRRPPDGPYAVVVRDAVRAHLNALHEHSAYTSANVRIYGQVPADVREAVRAVRSDYEALWRGLLTEGARRGALRPHTNLSHARLFLIGALNATLEWFDPVQGSIEELADCYTDMLLHGLLGQVA